MGSVPSYSWLLLSRLDMVPGSARCIKSWTEVRPVFFACSRDSAMMRSGLTWRERDMALFAFVRVGLFERSREQVERCVDLEGARPSERSGALRSNLTAVTF